MHISAQDLGNADITEYSSFAHMFPIKFRVKPGNHYLSWESYWAYKSPHTNHCKNFIFQCNSPLLETKHVPTSLAEEPLIPFPSHTPLHLTTASLGSECPQLESFPTEAPLGTWKFLCYYFSRRNKKYNRRDFLRYTQNTPTKETYCIILTVNYPYEKKANYNNLKTLCFG